VGAGPGHRQDQLTGGFFEQATFGRQTVTNKETKQTGFVWKLTP